MTSNADEILAVKYVTEKVCYISLRLFSCKTKEWREIMTAMKRLATILMAVVMAVAMMPMTARNVKAGGPCPKGGEHDWKLIYHKASFTDYGYQTAVCSKCGSDEGGMAIGGAPVTTVKLAKSSYVYTGKAIRPAVTIASADGPLSKEYYTLTYSNNTKVGTASVKITLTGEWFEGTKTLTFKITKAANPLAMKGKTASVKLKKLKKKPQTLAVTKLISFTKKADDKKAYTLSSAKKGKKNFKKYFKISKTTGKLTVKKGLKKGTYNVKVNVKASGNSNYQASAVKAVTCKIKVK